ncbi:MAG: YidC/Oxa1 family membrane protein insertase [Ruminococcaceae bacterium]|nr:YidC/Oxa1 family membrane protein insertase [Oscillospiraceae bacterium]
MNSLWDIINVPMGYVLRFCSWLTGNQYILALLVFAVIVELILLPFGIKQQKNSIKQAKLRPKEMAIRKKYAGRDDTPTKQKMSMEIQELYQKEGYNPMGGCLPLLIQFPILIALYNIVLNPLHYICRLSNDTIARLGTVVGGITGQSYDTTRNINLLGDLRRVYAEHPSAFAGIEEFTSTVKDVNDLPNLTVFNSIDLAQKPELALNWLLLVPILTFVAYFASMKLTRKITYQPMQDDKAMGCSNKVMDFMMPAFSVYIAFIMPAAIGVYWIFKCLIGMAKQTILHFAMPTPVFTEEDYKAAEKEMNVRPDKAPRTKSGKVVRSLHHIDDEDFPDTAEKARARREALEAQEAAELEEKKAGALAAAPIKEDELRAPKAKKAKKDSDIISPEGKVAEKEEKTEGNDEK